MNRGPVGKETASQTESRRALFFSFPIMRFGLAALILIWLSACGDWKTDPAVLTARSAAPDAGMSCVSCHAYPPQDSNHLFHLYQTAPDKFANGPITCLACHRNSLAAVEVALADTFFRNPDPNGDIPSVSSLNDPAGPQADSLALAARHWPIDSIVIRHQTHPLPQPGRPASDTGLTEFMTGLAHLNGTVDVVFDPKHSDPARFGGQNASFDPKEETCSAVACHPGNDPYRFGAPGKGLKGLRE
jgi:hypothetical protein